MSINTTLVGTPTVGLEDLQRAAFFVFYENFNNILLEVQAYWLPRDRIFDHRTGRTTAGITLEPIKGNNFHEGHKPSLVKSGPEAYPNIAVFANQGVPSSESGQFDQMQSWSDSMLVEIMVKGADEDVVNRRIQRTAEAAILCIRQNPTLGGACTGMEEAPSLAISDVFAIHGDARDEGTGARLIWQGAQITWSIRKDSITPPPTGSIFRNASSFDYSQADFDQS